MIQNKQENRLGRGSIAAILAVAVMILCPLAMSNFSDAEDQNYTEILTLTGASAETS